MQAGFFEPEKIPQSIHEAMEMAVADGMRFGC
jgi:hypothetical protein